MSLLQEKIRTEQSQKQEIDKKVGGAAVMPTEEEQKTIRQVTAEISEQFRDRLAKEKLTAGLQEEIIETIREKAKQLPVEYEQQVRIEKVVTTTVIGLGPLDRFQSDPEITEIIVQRYDNICVERHGVIEDTDAKFVSEDHLITVINRILQPLGLQINLTVPMVDARLPDGSRVNATIPPATPDGATMTIRKFAKDMMTGADYLSAGALSKPMLYFLLKCVQGKCNIIVSGGTSTGKTTLLNMLSSAIPRQELVVTIEDNCELQIKRKNLRRMETREVNPENSMPLTFRSEMKNALRMRPDRVILGETRDGTIFDVFTAMTTGHEGSMTTIHADSPRVLADARIPMLYAMNTDARFSEEFQRIQVAQAVDLIVQVTRGDTDGKRRITQVTAVTGVEDGKVRLSDIFKYDEKRDRFFATGFYPRKIVEKLERKNVQLDTSIFKKEAVPDGERV